VRDRLGGFARVRITVRLPHIASLPKGTFEIYQTGRLWSKPEAEGFVPRSYTGQRFTQEELSRAHPDTVVPRGFEHEQSHQAAQRVSPVWSTFHVVQREVLPTL
jgi:hypothetical protein